MHESQFLKIDLGEYKTIVRALIVYDHIKKRNLERQGLESKEISETQERWLSESERFASDLGDEEKEKIVNSAYDEVDDFIEGETWHELAWWIAERECRRQMKGAVDRDARNLVADQIYHEVMDEFRQHGISHLDLKGLVFKSPSLHRVSEALVHLRDQTKNLRCTRK
jgi:hypothetical protein